MVDYRNQYFLKTAPVLCCALLSGAEVNFPKTAAARCSVQACWGNTSREVSPPTSALINACITLITWWLQWRWHFPCPLQRSPLRSAAPRVLPAAACGEEPTPAGPCQPLPQRRDPRLAAGLCQGSCQVRFCLFFFCISHWKWKKTWISTTDSRAG